MNRSILPVLLALGMLPFLGAVEFSPAPSTLDLPLSLPDRMLGIPAEYYPAMRAAAEETGIPLSVLRDLIGHGENCTWDPLAVNTNANGTRDLGLCQHNSLYVPYFAERYNGGHPYDPMDPDEAIPVTARILADNLRQLGDMRLAVAAYRQGVKGVRENGPDEWYVARVLGEVER